ncbi:MAG: Crp/Fnr family transcriptional regulator [Bergeyella zoohelcum]|nr:Crp/Fnr family transcriptional regulator [Bergeyella zoohelcum]
MYALLKNHIAKHINLSEVEMEQFCQLFTPKQVKKKAFLLRQGEICKHENFVVKGLFKMYYLDKEGHETILYFAAEDWWVSDLDSFVNEKPSELYIEALEDSEVLQISKTDKDWAYENIPQIEKFIRIISIRGYINLQKRMFENLSKTADQRYLDFIKKYPHIAQRLSNVQLAKYLGITHEFLSKIRRKVVGK